MAASMGKTPISTPRCIQTRASAINKRCIADFSGNPDTAEIANSSSSGTSSESITSMISFMGPSRRTLDENKRCRVIVPRFAYRHVALLRCTLLTFVSGKYLNAHEVLIAAEQDHGSESIASVL